MKKIKSIFAFLLLGSLTLSGCAFADFFKKSDKGKDTPADTSGGGQEGEGEGEGGGGEVVVKYTVSFVANGGSGSMAAVADIKGTYTLPANGFTAPNGYHFAGWKVNNEGEAKQPGATIDVQGNVSLYAQWEADTPPVEVKYTITFDANGGEGQMASVEVVEGGNYTFPTGDAVLFTREGYDFAGWMLTEEGTETCVGLEDVRENTTIYAKWTEKQIPVTEHTITFDANGGEGQMASVKVEEGGSYTLPTGEDVKFSLEGFEFAGWMLSKDGTDVVTELTNVSEDKTVYAKWTQVTPPTQTHTVTFNVQGHGEAPAAQQVENGGLVSKPADPSADGYDFGGWYEEAECEDEDAWHFDSDVVFENTTLYAKWTAKTEPSLLETYRLMGLEDDWTAGQEGVDATVPEEVEEHQYAEQIKFTFSVGEEPVEVKVVGGEVYLGYNELPEGCKGLAESGHEGNIRITAEGDYTLFLKKSESGELGLWLAKDGGEPTPEPTLLETYRLMGLEDDWTVGQEGVDATIAEEVAEHQYAEQIKFTFSVGENPVEVKVVGGEVYLGYNELPEGCKGLAESGHEGNIRITAEGDYTLFLKKSESGELGLWLAKDGGEPTPETNYFSNKKVVVDTITATDHQDIIEPMYQGAYISLFDDLTFEMVVEHDDVVEAEFGIYEISEDGLTASLTVKAWFDGKYGEVFVMPEDAWYTVALTFDVASSTYTAVFEFSSSLFVTFTGAASESAPVHVHTLDFPIIMIGSDEDGWYYYGLAEDPTDLNQYKIELTLHENDEFVFHMGGDDWRNWENRGSSGFCDEVVMGSKADPTKEDDQTTHNFKATADGTYTVYIKKDGSAEGGSVFIVFDDGGGSDTPDPEPISVTFHIPEDWLENSHVIVHYWDGKDVKNVELTSATQVVVFEAGYTDYQIVRTTADSYDKIVWEGDDDNMWGVTNDLKVTAGEFSLAYGEGEEHIDVSTYVAPVTPEPGDPEEPGEAVTVTFVFDDSMLSDGAHLYVHYFNNDNPELEAKTVELTAESKTVVFEAGYIEYMIVRTTAESFDKIVWSGDDDNCWGKTGDIDIAEGTFTVAYGEGDEVLVVSEYVEPVTPPVQPEQPEQPVDPVDPVQSTTIYIETKNFFNSGASNEHVYVYAFKEVDEVVTKNADWPGEEATYICSFNDDENKKIFSFDVSEEFDTIIIVKVVDNQVTYQTVDISLEDMGEDNCIYLNYPVGNENITVGFYTYNPAE